MSWRRYIRWIKWPWRWVFDQRERKDYIAQAFSWTVAALIGPKSMVRQTWTGADRLEGAKDVAILVTWDTGGRVHDFLIEHMRALKKRAAPSFSSPTARNFLKARSSAQSRIAR